MFKKREQGMMNQGMDDFGTNSMDVVKKQKPNTILKGSKLIGDINITYDLELDGDVEGNITSDLQSNIVIKGNCKGSIRTREGNVDIGGQMTNGDVIAGGDVKITGKFSGGKVEAKGKIYINGGFSGKFESSEIEIGPNAQGDGDLFYKENISIAKGAKVDIRISQIQMKQKESKKVADIKVLNLEMPSYEKKEAL